MTKEEKIQETYGVEVWECIDDSVKENILSNSGGWSYEINEKWLQNTKGIAIELNGKYCRPIHLKGIENNNGWIKIESKNDLPKKQGEYWILENGLVFICFIIVSNEKIMYSGAMENVTHYQPIIKPNLPLY
jgi:hypothetical protein